MEDCNCNTNEQLRLVQADGCSLSMHNGDENIFCMHKGEEGTTSTTQHRSQTHRTYQHSGQRANKGNEEKYYNNWMASHWLKLVCFVTVVLVMSVLLQSWNNVTKTRQHGAVHERVSAKFDDFSISTPLLTMRGFGAKTENPKEEVSLLLCDELLLGAWVETCFFAEASTSSSNGNATIFPGMQGILSYPIIIVTPYTAIGTNQKRYHYNEEHDIQFHLYGYSVREPFFDGEDYLEWGEGQHSRVQVPSATHHCVATFKSRLMVGQDNWSFDEGDYFWNALGGQLMSGNGKNVACFFRRLYGSECRQVRQAVIDKFELFTNLTDMNDRLPSEQSLCN